jgi:methionine aminopeptidase
VLKELIKLAVDGAKVLDLCIKGDELIEQGTGAVYNKNVKGAKVPKGAPRSAIYPTAFRFLYSSHQIYSLGIAFPTCISVNNVVAHFSPLACVPLHHPPDLIPRR